MLTIILLIVLLSVEIGLGVWCLNKKAPLLRQKANVRLIELLIFIFLVLSPVIEWSFRWYGLALLLVLIAVVAVIKALKSKKTKLVTKGRVIGKLVLKTLIFILVLLPAFLFPQDCAIEPTGEYGIKTMCYTWTDETRDETFTPEADHRSITVQFWYPAKDKSNKEVAEGKFPLVIFSHGAFGIRVSNYSTYSELVSHGYVVCSIDHTYHSFFSQQTDGKVILGNSDFFNDAMTLGNEENDETKYEKTQGWHRLRVEDMTFCLNQIKAMVNKKAITKEDEVFSMIDLDNIGLMGHSLGGSCAAGVGREVEGINAVVVIDGTMIGEKVGFKDGMEQVTKEPYPIPLLNFYNGPSYNQIEQYKDFYPNTLASASQEESYQIAIMNAGHMNFTDLSLVSPFLAGQLGAAGEGAGTGQIDSKACMRFVNKTVLEFFDGYLKGKPISLPKEQVITIE